MKSCGWQTKGGGFIWLYRSPEVLDEKTLARRVAHGGKKARRAKIRLAKLYVSPEVRALVERMYERAYAACGITEIGGER